MLPQHQEGRPHYAVWVCKELEKRHVGAAIVAWIAFQTGRPSDPYTELPRKAVTADTITGGLTVVRENLLGAKEVHHLWHPELDGVRLTLELGEEGDGYSEPLVGMGVGRPTDFENMVADITGSFFRTARCHLPLAGARDAVDRNRVEAFCRYIKAEPEVVREMAARGAMSHEIGDILGWELIPGLERQ